MIPYKLLLGDSLDRMKTLEDNRIDSIITDPPYGINFMSKNWDNGIPGIPYWQEALRAIKPGGHMLAFGGTRTHHRLMCAIEDAGWEIRDVCMWVYSSGFPKSLDVSKELDKIAGAEREVIGRKEGDRYKYGFTSDFNGESDTSRLGSGDAGKLTAPATDLAKEYDGWGTGLKPAWEPIVLARKPLSEKNIALNVTRWGTGAINIKASKIDGDTWHRTAGQNSQPYGSLTTWNASSTPALERTSEGRWPANFFLDDELEEPFAKYFYCSKAQKRDRDEGLDSLPDSLKYSHMNKNNGTTDRFDGSPTPIAKNIHPTVKPTDLLRYLNRMITPYEGFILDPFMGSGSTGKAAMLDGFNFIGIDIDETYLEIARLRIEHARKT